MSNKTFIKNDLKKKKIFSKQSVPRYEDKEAKVELDKKTIKCKAENRLSSKENSYIKESYSEDIVIDVLCKSNL